MASLQTPPPIYNNLQTRLEERLLDVENIILTLRQSQAKVEGMHHDSDLVPSIPKLSSIERLDDEKVSALADLEGIQSSVSGKASKNLKAPFSRSTGKKQSDHCHIHFVDALKRTYKMPFECCETWADMSAVVHHIFKRIPLLATQISMGRYDILNQHGETMLPELWEQQVLPGGTYSMAMWAPFPNHEDPLGFPTWPTWVTTNRPNTGPFAFGPPPQLVCTRAHCPPRSRRHSTFYTHKHGGIKGFWRRIKGYFKKRGDSGSDSDWSVDD